MAAQQTRRVVSLRPSALTGLGPVALVEAWLLELDAAGRMPKTLAGHKWHLNDALAALTARASLLRAWTSRPSRTVSSSTTWPTTGTHPTAGTPATHGPLGTSARTTRWRVG